MPKSILEDAMHEMVKESDTGDEKIKGYHALTKTELGLINEGKDLEKQCIDYISRLQSCKDAFVTQVDIATGKTNIRQGFMWIIRGIARPDEF